MVVEWLRLKGYEAAVAGSVAEGVRLAQSESFDL